MPFSALDPLLEFPPNAWRMHSELLRLTLNSPQNQTPIYISIFSLLPFSASVVFFSHYTRPFNILGTKTYVQMFVCLFTLSPTLKIHFPPLTHPNPTYLLRPCSRVFFSVNLSLILLVIVIIPLHTFELCYCLIASPLENDTLESCMCPNFQLDKHVRQSLTI